MIKYGQVDFATLYNRFIAAPGLIDPATRFILNIIKTLRHENAQLKEKINELNARLAAYAPPDSGGPDRTVETNGGAAAVESHGTPGESYSQNREENVTPGNPESSRECSENPGAGEKKYGKRR